MGLEAVTWISDLVVTNPVGATDPKSQGDDHLRNLKIALKNCFANITGAVTATQADLNNLAGSHNLLDAKLSTNVPLLNAANIFTSSNPTAVFAAAIPMLEYKETDQGTDLKRWQFYTDGAAYTGRVVDDAGANAFNFLNVSRTGTGSGVSSNVISLNANSVTIGGGNGGNQAILRLGTTVSSGFSAANRGTFEVGGVTDAMIGLSTAGSARGWLYHAGAGGALQLDQIENAALQFATSNVVRMSIDGSGNYSFGGGTVSRSNVSASEVGRAGMVQRNITASDSTLATDQEGVIYITGTTAAQTFTLNANPPANAVVCIVNNSNQSWTIAASASLSAGGTVGSRAMAAQHVYWFWHQGSGNWFGILG